MRPAAGLPLTVVLRAGRGRAGVGLADGVVEGAGVEDVTGSADVTGSVDGAGAADVTGSVDGAGVGVATGAGVDAAVRMTATLVAMTNDAATVPRRIHGFVDAFAMRPAVALRPATWVTRTPEVNRLMVRMIRAVFAVLVVAVRTSGDAAAW